MRKYIIQMVARFQCKASMTTTTLTEVLDEFEELLINTSEFLKKKVSDFFVEEGLINNDRAKNILSAFNFDEMFTGLKTLDNQIAALEAHFGYIHPVEIPLGYRIDQKLDRSSGTYSPDLVMETYQYVPVIDTLKLVISNPDILQAILTE
ncbi:GSCOCG00012934001-RA-CDS [Cotesia congregata]|nr:GSCOCG00012934001-RA-CDS [Cotesia congregata]